MTTLKKPVGRPTVITPDVLENLRKAFLMGCTDIEACLYANISRTALNEYMEKNPDFRTGREEWKNNPILKARQNVYEAIEDKNLNSSQWYLERKKKDEFSQRTETTGKDGKDLPTPILNVSTNNSDKKNNADVQEDQGSTRGDISEQDDFDSIVSDSSSPERQETNTNIDSLGIISSLEEGGDEGLPADSEGT